MSKEIERKLEILNYSKAKRQLLNDSNTYSFESIVNKYNLRKINEQKGLFREYRAYKWLKALFSNKYKILPGTIDEDVNKGIDLVAHRLDGTGEKLFFAVSGPSDKEDKQHCHYKIIVTKEKIYLKKLDKNINDSVNWNEMKKMMYREEANNYEWNNDLFFKEDEFTIELVNTKTNRVYKVNKNDYHWLIMSHSKRRKVYGNENDLNIIKAIICIARAAKDNRDKKSRKN